MMDVYVFIGEDRHTDDKICVFSSLEKAKDYLSKWLEDYKELGYHIEKEYDNTDADTCHFIGYSIGGEGDFASIQKCEVDRTEDEDE